MERIDGHIDVHSTEDYSLESLVDLPRLQEMAEHLYAAGGIPIGILALDGKILVGAGWQDICTKYHRKHPETGNRCKLSDQYIFSHLGEGPYVAYKCLNHMWDIAIPIVVESHPLGTLFVGQFFYDDEEIDFERFRGQAAEFGFDWEDYRRALESVPTFSHERVRHMMAYYADLVDELARTGLMVLRLRRAEAGLQNSLREMGILNKEVHHRVKNSLNVIVSLLGLQIGAENDPARREVLGITQGRVYAIALIHELLYRQERLSSLDLGEYLRTLVGRMHEIFAGKGVEVSEIVNADDLSLDANRAVSCGIIVGELLTNAYKHAFRGRNAGRIELEASRDGDELVITLRDDGPGAPEEAISPDASTLGMQIVRSLAVDQLGGSLRMWNDHGLACRIAFKSSAERGAA